MPNLENISIDILITRLNDLFDKLILHDIRGDLVQTESTPTNLMAIWIKPFHFNWPV